MGEMNVAPNEEIRNRLCKLSGAIQAVAGWIDKSHVAIGPDYIRDLMRSTLNEVSDALFAEARTMQPGGITTDERELLNRLYEAHPELRDDPSDFDGWYADWNEIIDVCKDDPACVSGYGESPIELIRKIQDDRDEWKAKAEESGRASPPTEEAAAPLSTTG